MNVINKAKKKYGNLPVQAKAALCFIVCGFFQKGISFITAPIFTRLMTVDQYGTYSLYTSWLSMISIFTSLNLHCGVFDNAMSKFENDRDKFISSMQGLTITITSGYFLLYIIFHNYWEQVIGLSSIYIFFMFTEMYVTPAFSFWSGRKRFEYSYLTYSFVVIARTLITPLLGIIFVVLLIDRAFGKVLSIVIVECCICGYFLIVQFLNGKCFVDKKYWQYAITLAIPLFPHYLAGSVLGFSDRIVIGYLIGKSEVALYSVAYTVGMLMQLFTVSISNAITPWFYSKLKIAAIGDIKNRTNSLFLLVAILCIGFILISPEIMFAFGEKYEESVYVIPPVVISMYFVFLYNIFTLPQFYFEKTRFLFISSGVAALLNMILNYIFVPLCGYIAAAYTTLVCYITYSIGHYYISSSIVKESLSNNSLLFDTRFVFFISLALVMIAIAINTILPYVLLRYFIVLIGIIVGLVKKEKIIFILKQK